MCPVVTSDGTCVPSCGMDSRGTGPRAVFARGGICLASLNNIATGAVLLEGSLAYNGAWRLAEGWLLFFSLPSAARGHLLSPLSFSRLHTLCGHPCSVLRASPLLHLLRVDGTLLL